MLKFLLIVGLIAYIIYKIGSWFYRAGAASQQFRNQQHYNDVNTQPNDAKKKGKFNGGEYIDYEEVK